MGIGSNPLMALMRQRADGEANPNPIPGMSPGPADMDIGLQDPNVLPEAPQQGAPPSNGDGSDDVLPPHLNPIKGLFHKMAWALGQSIRQQFGMPTDVELAQQDFKNRLEVKTYKMQQAAAQSQEEMRKEQIAQSRQERQMVNVPGVGNFQVKDMPQVMNMLAQRQYHQQQLERDYAIEKRRAEDADENRRSREQYQSEGFALRRELAADRAANQRTSYQPLTDAQGNITGFFDIHNPTNRISAQDIGRRSAASPEQQKISANAGSGLKAIQSLRDMIKNDKSLLLKGALPGSIGARKFNAIRNEITDVITRLRTGAALNMSEETFYKGQMPGLLDLTEPGAIDTKLKIYEDLFTNLSGGAPPASAVTPPNSGLATPKSGRPRSRQ